MKTFNKTICGSLLALLASTNAFANDSTAENAVAKKVEINEQQDISASQWEYKFSPYIWFAAVKGDGESVPGLGEAPIDVSSNQAINDTDIMFMGLFEAKLGKHGYLVDIMYSEVGSDEDLPPGTPDIDILLDSVAKTTIFSLAYSYEIFNNANTVVDVYAGARYWHIDTTVNFASESFPVIDGFSADHTESWWDPLVGVKATKQIKDTNFYVAGNLTVGGFDVGSKAFYDYGVNVGYNFSDNLGASVGYRVFDLDYTNGDFYKDYKQDGFVVGMTWTF